MRWNKNPASYVAWSFIFILSFIGLLFSATAVTASIGLPFFAGVGASVVLAGLLFVIAFLVAKVRNSLSKPIERPLVYLILSIFVFAAGTVAAFVWRLSLLADTYAESPYYLFAKVVFGQKVPQFVHGALNTYMQFLHEVYFFFGNTAENGIYIQLILLAAAAILLGLAAGCLDGKFSACVTFLGVSLLPGIGREALIFSPALMYFVCWSFVFLLLCVFSKKKGWFVSAPVLGLMIGALIYLDASGILLLAVVPVLYYTGNKEEDFDWIKTVACFGESVLTAAGSFLISILIDSVYSGKQFGSVLYAWTRVIEFRIPSLELLQAQGYLKPLSGIAFTVILLGCFDFWFHKEKENVKGYSIMLLLYVLGEIFGLFNNKVSGRMFVAAFLYIMAASMMKDLLFADRNAVKPTVEEKKPQKKVEEVSDTDRYEKAPEFADKDIVFLENPLPLPKKHVKKVNDFDLDSDDLEDDYDYEVADDDDYDVP